MLIDNVLILSDYAQPHINIRTRKTITLFGWTTLPHPPCSRELARLDYHLFGPMKEGFRGKHYASNEQVKIAIIKWLKDQSAEFYDARNVKHPYWEKRWQRWRLGLWFPEDQLHFDLCCMFLCRVIIPVLKENTYITFWLALVEPEKKKRKYMAPITSMILFFVFVLFIFFKMFRRFISLKQSIWWCFTISFSLFILSLSC